MSLLRRSVGSAVQAGGRFIVVLAVITLAGTVANWALLLGLLPLPGAGALELSREAGWLAGGARVVVFGIAFPLAWLVAAQPAAMITAARHVYRRHKDDVVAAIHAVLRLELGEQAEADATHWLSRLEELESALEARQPAVLRPFVRLALALSSLPEIEQRVRTGSGPIVTRIAVAVADQIEAELREGASTWLWLVGIANAGAMVVAALVAR